MVSFYHTQAAAVLSLVSAFFLGALYQACTGILSLPLRGITILVSGVPFQAVLLVIIYRLTLHPLAKYPGPLLGACTDWYTVYWHINGSRHLELYKQHKQHGKHVRYGPNSLSINSDAASRDLHVVKANTRKAPMYAAAKPFFGAEMSLSLRDTKAHGFRRRINMSVMTPDAIRALGGRIQSHVGYFVESVADTTRQSPDKGGWSPGLDMARMVSYLTADLITDLTFSQSWNAQRSPENRTVVHNLPKGVAGMILCGHMLSLFTFNMHKLLFRDLIDKVNRQVALGMSCAMQRMQDKANEVRRHDFWETLMAGKDPKTGQTFTIEELTSEAFLFIAAGTDTVNTALSAVLFYLSRTPTALGRLTREIRDKFPARPDQDGKGDVPCPIDFSSPELAGVTYVYACIDEALRLCPPIPSILPRQVDAGGMMVDGEFFPEGVVLGIPHYVMHRNEAYFDNPLEFHPERWLDSSDSRSSASPPARPGAGQGTGFTPFGVGRYSCIGRQLAYQEISYVLARLVWSFDIRVEPGNTVGEGTGAGAWGRGKRDEYQLYDHHVAEQHGPVLQFRLRSGVRGE
ncbi:cytochrome P450 [Xylariaceae sp. FL0804]|nr:cytochrome P450 [Xylariaceae sp. FL0804]